MSAETVGLADVRAHRGAMTDLRISVSWSYHEQGRKILRGNAASAGPAGRSLAQIAELLQGKERGQDLRAETDAKNEAREELRLAKMRIEELEYELRNSGAGLHAAMVQTDQITAERDGLLRLIASSHPDPETSPNASSLGWVGS